MTDRADRIADLARAAASARESLDPAAPAGPDRAATVAAEGVGPTVAVYVEARTGEGAPAVIDPETFAELERALNDWLAAFSACHGVDADPDATVRTAAELLLETRDARAVAATLTGVGRASPAKDH